VKEKIRRALVGEHPGAWVLLAAPTLLALVLDLALRGRRLAGYALQGKAIYGSSLLVSAAFWILPLALSARLFVVRDGSKRVAARLAITLFFVGFVLPMATMSFAGQALYHRVFDAYMGRDTLRLGIGLRGTVGDWFRAWGGPWLLFGMIVVGAAITFGLFTLVRRNAARLAAGPVPVVFVVTFCAACTLVWFDQVDSRFLQAATPDACFLHASIHALRMAVSGKASLHQGMSLRSPAPLPKLTSARATPPNVVVVFLESVRADALCSDPPPLCRDETLDAVAADRISLGKLTTQTPNTFSASMILWTGLPPNVAFETAHEAPVLWELARAVGYRTAYLSAQNPEYEDFGAFVRNAGIDVLRTATDLGGMAQEQLGAPDERATAAALLFAQANDPRPYFAFVHLSNTHAPYRTDPSLLPFQPESATPVAPVEQFHNHYMNSVRLEARLLADLIRALRATPRWDRTAVVVLSDHGEQFREHGGLYHNHSLFDEELRIPGFVVAGKDALSNDERAALATFAGARTYMQDAHETIVDLLGVEPSRTKLPFASLVAGRSLLHPRLAAWEPMVQLATSTGVWEPDDPRFGVMWRDKVVVGEPGAIPWSCFDLSIDPLEHAPLDASACGAAMVDAANRAFHAQ